MTIKDSNPDQLLGKSKLTPDEFIIKTLKDNPKTTQTELTDLFNGDFGTKRAQSTIGKRIKDLGFVKTDKGYIKKSNIRRKQLLKAIKSLMQYTTLTVISSDESAEPPYVELKIKDDSLTQTLSTLFAKYFSQTIQYSTTGYKYMKLTFIDSNGHKRFMDKFYEFTQDKYNSDDNDSDIDKAVESDEKYENIHSKTSESDSDEPSEVSDSDVN